jgi:hypothetical protein
MSSGDDLYLWCGIIWIVSLIVIIASIYYIAKHKDDSDEKVQSEVSKNKFYLGWGIFFFIVCSLPFIFAILEQRKTSSASLTAGKYYYF